MITRVKIKGYKSLKDVEINLQPLTVFIGPNASGKSNLFDALRLLSRCVTSQTLGEAFKGHRGAPVEAFFYRERGLAWLLTQPAAQFTIDVDMKLSTEVVETVERRIREIQSGENRVVSETRLRYTLTVEMAMDSGHLGVKEERLVALNPEGTEKRSLEPFIQCLEGHLHLRVEDQDQSYKYLAGQEYTVASISLHLPSHPHVATFKEELSRWRFYYLDPETMRAENPLKEAELLGSSGADLAAFYHTLRARHPRQFEALQRALPLLLPEVQNLGVERTAEGLLRLLILESGVSYSARTASEGTLRILGLLAITNPLVPATVTGYEEPENGVHPRRLQLMAELFKNVAEASKQVLINTHSPKLPEYFAPDSLVICRKEKGETRFTPFQDLGPLFRRDKIEQALEETPLTERVLRGDFGG
jgi:predicted ATPase